MMIKRTISFLLTILILFCSVACKKQETSSNATTASTAMEKPKSITVMWDDTMPTDDNKGETFAKELSKELGIEVKLITPVAASYYDVLNLSFMSDDVPDVFVLAADKYAHYAKTGVLWDMKDAWDNSELKASGRLDKTVIERLSTLEIEGKDNKIGMYGFNIERGIQYATIVRTDWLEECDLEAPKNYEEFLNMCKIFKEKYDRVPYYFATPQFEGNEFTVHAPEIIRDARFDFYKNEEGKWIDGFTEEKTKEAIARWIKAKTEGLALEATFCTKDEDIDYHIAFHKGMCGVITTEYGQIRRIARMPEGENIITIIEPIEELKGYYTNPTYVLAISNKAQNPEGIFKHFIEPIYDGGKVQSLWTYGVQGVHWDYKDGQIVGYNVIAPTLSFGKIDAANDPLSKVTIKAELEEQILNIVNKYEKTKEVLYNSEGIQEKIDVINKKREELCNEIVYSPLNNDKDAQTIVEELYKEYKEAVGNEVEECLRILNE